MLSWQEYCKELAEYFIEKYKPTKLEILQVASNGGWNFFGGEKFPYPITKKQILKYDSLGGDREEFLSTVYRYFLLNLFPEFNGNNDFIVLFAYNEEFWRLNLLFYKHKQKTIFENYDLPNFDWDAWGKSIFSNDKKVFQEGMQLLREYDDQIMRIVHDAVACL